MARRLASFSGVSPSFMTKPAAARTCSVSSVEWRRMVAHPPSAITTPARAIIHRAQPIRRSGARTARTDSPGSRRAPPRGPYARTGWRGPTPVRSRLRISSLRLLTRPTRSPRRRSGAGLRPRSRAARPALEPWPRTPLAAPPHGGVPVLPSRAQPLVGELLLQLEPPVLLVLALRPFVQAATAPGIRVHVTHLPVTRRGDQGSRRQALKGLESFRRVGELHLEAGRRQDPLGRHRTVAHGGASAQPHQNRGDDDHLAPSTMSVHGVLTIETTARGSGHCPRRLSGKNAAG